jgi:uncharacterized protein (TIGR03663 family)
MSTPVPFGPFEMPEVALPRDIDAPILSSPPSRLRLLMGSAEAWLRRQPSQLRARARGLTTLDRWELAAFSLVLVIALGMRLWDLGGRTLHYDEILHAYYSWLYSVGQGYSHTPLMHGPFLFHVAAGSYILFGSSDAMARLAPALFGAALVFMPYFLRRELGRPGALAAAVVVAVSPSILYFSRFARNDIYMAVWVLGLVIVMWRYLHHPRPRLLFAWVGLWALAFTTKETAYITAGILGLALLSIALPELFRWVAGRLPLSAFSPSAVLLLVLVTVTLPLWTPLLGLFQDVVGITLVNADPNDPLAGATRAAVETGAPAGGGIYVAAFVLMALTGLSIAVGLAWNRRRWPLLALLFLAIWMPLYTSLFTNREGFFTGLWGSLGYWIAQQPVERASQPWYYYLILIANYEFLAFLPALIGTPFLLWRGRLFDRFMIFWSVATIIMYTFAGEKMPWLMVGITLPLAVLSGRSVGLLLTAVPWAALDRRWAGVIIAIGAALLFLLAAVALQATGSSQFAGSPGYWLPLSGTMVLAGLTVYLAFGDRLSSFSRRVQDSLTAGVDPWHPKRTIMALLSLGALVVALGMTVFVAGRASYSHAGFQRPTELLVYSQTGQETTLMAQRIERIAEESGKGKDGLRLLVGQSDNFAWQWRWYLRDYSQVSYRSLNSAPLSQSPEVDVVLFSKAVERSNQQALGAFTSVGDLHHLWWFPNTVYEGLSPGNVLSGVADRAAWRGALDYFFWRQMRSPMYRSNGVMYVADEYADIE